MAVVTIDEDGGGAAPIDMLEAWFEAHGWTNERVGDDEIVASAAGAWGAYELRGVWRDDDNVLQFLAFPDIRVSEHQTTAVYEAIGLINEQMWLGHFELWGGSGTLLFRHAALLDDAGDAALLTLSQAETVIEIAVDELDRFYPVFQFVLWGGKSPKDAIAAAMVETRGEA
ncbi:MAG: YbjN domain-containing protein [Sphingomonadaceae bacterium]|nr:YbjN domain-containing protein [Sphingomonadaceae bacterium]